MGLTLVAASFLRATGPATSDAIPGNIDGRGFRFMAVDASTGEPVRFNPCSPVHYVINPDLAPAGGVADVHTAIEETERGTGLQFVYDGVTDEVPSDLRAPYQPDRYGDRWAPILLAWASDLPSGMGPEMQTVGRAGSLARPNDDGESVYVTGMAVFNAGADLQSGYAGHTWGQAIVHEMGHIVGLDHIEDGASVMNPVMGLRPAGWGPGDRRGLWELGLGSDCLRVPEPG